MKAVYSPLHARHDGGVELYRGALVPTFETPERAEIIRAALAAPATSWSQPREIPESRLLRVHDAEFVEFLRGAYARWHAEGRQGHVLAERLPGARPAARPPAGRHQRLARLLLVRCEHADRRRHLGRGARRRALRDDRGRDRVRKASARPTRSAGRRAITPRAAPTAATATSTTPRSPRSTCATRAAAASRVLDVDYHHGNGTQEIFWERDDVQFVSLHGDPETEYPWFMGYADERGAGRGEGCTLNLPLPAGTGWDAYRRGARHGARCRSARYAPDALVVSLGVDTFAADPISAFKLESRHYPLIGERLAGLGLPTVLVQEGGYAVAEIGDERRRAFSAPLPIRLGGWPSATTTATSSSSSSRPPGA